MACSLSGRGSVMAVVLGTALTTLGPGGVAKAEAVGDLSRYCNACWRNAHLDPGCWSDCTQEVLCRLLQRIPATTWSEVLSSEGEERREFLRAIDAVKKRTQRQRRWTMCAPESLPDCRGA